MEDNRNMLRQAQEELKLNQKELGVYIGVSTRTVNSWMTGERECPSYVAEMVHRLAQIDRKAMENGESTSGMFRWAVIDEIQDGDEFLTVCGSKADAIREAQRDWERMTPKDRERRARFEVGLIRATLMDQTVDGSRFTYYQDDKGHIDGDTYETAKDWKQ